MSKTVYYCVFVNIYLIVERDQLYFADSPEGAPIKPPKDWIIGGVKEKPKEKTFFLECLRGYKHKYRFKNYNFVYVGIESKKKTYIQIDVVNNKHKFKHRKIKLIETSQ